MCFNGNRAKSEIGGSGAVAGSLEPVALIDVTTVDDDAFSVKVGVFQVLGSRYGDIGWTDILSHNPSLRIVNTYVNW